MLTKYEEKMNKTITVLQDEFISIRAGRANPNILDKVKVDYYGSETPINQLAGISVAEARVLVIQPYDMFPQTKHIETLVKLEKKNK